MPKFAMDLAELPKLNRPVTLAPIECTRAMEMELRLLCRGPIMLWRRKFQEQILPVYRATRLTADAGEPDSSPPENNKAEQIKRAIDETAAIVAILLLGTWPRFRQWANRVETWHRLRTIAVVRSATGADLAMLLNFRDVSKELEAAIQRLRSLMTDAAQAMRRRIEQAVWDGVAKGTSIRDVTETVMRGFDIAQRQADNIAEEQAVSLVSDLTRLRHEQLGITEYRWRTMRDDRVRPSHAAKDDKIFRWDRPPADTGHPGDDYNCRCVALGYIRPSDRGG